MYSWDQFVKDGETSWTGIRNYAARLHLKAMKKNDQVLFYHSNEGLEIVGIAKLIREFYPDPTTDNEAWFAVDIKPVKKLRNTVTLAQIKNEKRLANMALIRISRLSVGPVTPEEWGVVMELAGM
jgi:predicted RNA-binding protein with PUA-like domain